MHEKTNLQQKCSKKQEKQGSLSKRTFFLCNFCPTTKRQFFVPDPKRRLTQENQEKKCQETLQNSKNMEETINKDDAMTKNIIQNTEEKIVQKSKTPFRLQNIDHRKC